MRAAVFNAPGQPLELVERPDPAVLPNTVSLKVEACGVCRTDLHIVDGELPTRAPRILGHQIVGRDLMDRRFGATWLAWACGTCEFCQSGRENLCQAAKFMGRDVDGGFAEQVLVDRRFIFPLPETSSAAELAPWLCGGLIGYRALRMAGDPQTIGIYGFGSAGNILLQIARAQGRSVFAFTREGDVQAQEAATDLGAKWAGASTETPPEQLDAAIIFAPVGELVPLALAAVKPGGTVVCGGIHMSPIPAFPYSLLWQERKLVSVANLTRADGEEFLDLARESLIRTFATTYPLEGVNEALSDLRDGRLSGSAVIVP